MADTFLVSVADAIGLDPNTRTALFSATANMTSAFKLAMQATDVRGGKNNPLRYKFMHDRELSVDLTQATFSKNFLALNVGETVTNGSVQVVMQEKIQLTAGSGAVTQTPVGDVNLIKDDGTIATVTPSSKNVTLNTYTGIVTAIYDYMETADRVSIGSTKPPAIITLVLIAEVRDNRNNISEYLQIEIPSFQILGNYDLSLDAGGVSNEALSGSALSVAGSTLSEGDTFGYVTWIPAASTTIDVIAIAATPTVFKPTAGALATQQITVTGIRGGMYSNITLDPADCTFSKLAGGDSDVTVASTGIISVAATSTASDTATIKVVYGSLEDYVLVQVQ